VDEIRELAARAHFAPMRGQWRIYIIDEAHGLSTAGGQAFLKLLEEPPSHVIFMLATTDPEKMLHTNRSRCTEFELVSPSREELVANVVRVANAEGVSLTPVDGLEVINASPSELGLRGALMSLEKVLPALRAAEPISIAELLGKPSRVALDELCSALSARDTALAVSRFVSLRTRFPVSQLLSSLADLMHDALIDAVVQNKKDAASYLTAADALIHARRDGSDLAAVAAILCASGLSLCPPSVPAPPAESDVSKSDLAPPTAAPSPVVVAPAIAVPPSDTTAPTSTCVPAGVSAPTSASEDSSAQKNLVDAPYAIDPWSSATSSVPATPEVSPEAALGELLGALAAQKTANARLLQASLRGLKVSSAAGILTIECTSPARRIVSMHVRLLHEAAATCGLEVRVLPE
jgi:DNA polymerase-3 subunit gamma/tau